MDQNTNTPVQLELPLSYPSPEPTNDQVCARCGSRKDTIMLDICSSCLEDQRREDNHV